VLSSKKCYGKKESLKRQLKQTFHHQDIKVGCVNIAHLLTNVGEMIRMNKLEKKIKKLMDSDKRKKIHKKDRSFFLLNVPTDTIKELDEIINLYINAKRRIVLGCVSNKPIDMETQKKMIKSLEVTTKAKMCNKPVQEMMEEIYDEFEEVKETGFEDPKDTRYIG